MLRDSVRSFARVGVLALVALVVAAPAMANTAADCTGTGATSWIDYVLWNNDTVTAEGYWSVSGASSSRIEYRIDGTLYQTSYYNGSSGWWLFADNFTTCGNHTLEVEVCPRVWDGSGYTICHQHCATDTMTFTSYACLDVDYTCSLSGPNGVVGVEGTVVTGTAPYKVETYSPSAWVTKYASTTSTGPFSYSNRCSYEGYKVGMRITDANGSVETRYCYCDLVP